MIINLIFFLKIKFILHSNYHHHLDLLLFLNFYSLLHYFLHHHFINLHHLCHYYPINLIFINLLKFLHNFH